MKKPFISAITLRWSSLLPLCVAACLLATLAMGCATSEAARQQRAQKLAMTQKKMSEGLAQRHYTIDIDRAHPQGPVGVITLTSPYSVTVSGDTLKSDLPFFGRAYSVPYGGGKGLRFTAPITYYEEADNRRGEHIVYIDATDTEDSYRYIITLLVGGSASVSVQPRQRSHIEFTGQFREE